jgi:Domain of unknown function (DUF4345)
MLLGARMVPGVVGAAPPNIDNEFRFFGAWYAVAGVFILQAARRNELTMWLVRGVAATLFGAASARLLGWATVGRPTSFQFLLTAIEYTLSVVLVVWQASVMRAPPVEQAR